MQLQITVTKTSNGLQEYVQIISDDMTSVCVVLVADHIDLRDERKDDDGEN